MKGSQRQSVSSKRFDDIAEAVKRIQEDMNDNRECINPLRFKNAQPLSSVNNINDVNHNHEKKSNMRINEMREMYGNQSRKICLSWIEKGLSYQHWILVVTRDFPELSTVYQIFSTPSSNDSYAALYSKSSLRLLLIRLLK